MSRFTTQIKKFDKQGEKTGWTYIEIPQAVIQKLKPGHKTSFRVKGKLDYYSIEKIALLPMGDGNFIMPLNATIRKGIKKQKGATLEVQLQTDDAPLLINADFMECLNEEPAALKTSKTLAKGHQNYFSKWIESAKTEATKAKRIAMALQALDKGWGYPDMMRANKKDKQQYGL